MGLDALERSCCDAFVQATSVGMGTESAGELAMPIPAMRACQSAGVRPLLIETIYHPLETPVLRAARRAGWRTVDGLELFVRQAELQSEAFCLGKAPRAGMMREVVLAERAG
jgi:shikimate dehydrogenase